MMQLAPGTQVWLSCRPTDMRKGFDGLAAQVKNVLSARSVLRAFIRVPWQARRLREDTALGRLGAVPVRQAIGEGPVCVAAYSQ